MAIVFDWYENPNASSEEEAALHPRIFMNGKVDTDTLCYKIHDYSSLTVGDVKNVLDNLSKILGESLREGKEVHIEGIGYFYPTLEATGKVTRSTPHKTNKVAFKTVRFRPDSNLKGYFVGVRASQETGVSLYKSDLCGIIIKNIRWKIKEILKIQFEKEFNLPIRFVFIEVL